MFLAMGGIAFAGSGGVFDGLGLTAKIMIERMHGDYEERRSKEKSPKSSLLVFGYEKSPIWLTRPIGDFS